MELAGQCAHCDQVTVVTHYHLFQRLDAQALHKGALHLRQGDR